MHRTTPRPLLLLLSVAACTGDDVTTSLSASGTATAATTGGSATTTPTTAGPSTGSTGTATTAATTSASDPSTGTLGFDLGRVGDFGGTGGCEGGPLEFSHAWLNNGFDNTVSRVDTLSVTETGRFLVHPDGVWGGKPHHTAVNLVGDVAVANSCSLGMPPTEDCGGVAKIAGPEDHCVDRNGMPGIQTSQGAGDVLGFLEDECVLWHRTMPGRNWPVAWTSGVQQGCEWVDMKVWTATTEDGGVSTVYLLNGDDGSIEQTIPIPEVTDSATLHAGAVDSNNDFWVTAIQPQIVHVDAEDFTHEVIPAPHFMWALTIDTSDRLWTVYQTTISRYDPALAAWDSIACPDGGQCNLVAQAGDGDIWVAVGVIDDPRLLRLDPESMAIVEQLPAATFPDLTVDPRGLGFDAEGYMWLVGGLNALKVDLGDDNSYEVFVKDHQTATMHSDFTGFGLTNLFPPAG